MQPISTGNRSIDPSNCRTRFIHTENAPSGITSGMSIINYEWYINRPEEEKKADDAILEKKFAELYSMLLKAHLGRR